MISDFFQKDQKIPLKKTKPFARQTSKPKKTLIKILISNSTLSLFDLVYTYIPFKFISISANQQPNLCQKYLLYIKPINKVVQKFKQIIYLMLNKIIQLKSNQYCSNIIIHQRYSMKEGFLLNYQVQFSGTQTFLKHITQDLYQSSDSLNYSKKYKKRRSQGIQSVSILMRKCVLKKTKEIISDSENIDCSEL